MNHKKSEEKVSDENVDLSNVKCENDENRKFNKGINSQENNNNVVNVS